jgi:hypothetical protein
VRSELAVRNVNVATSSTAVAATASATDCLMLVCINVCNFTRQFTCMETYFFKHKLFENKELRKLFGSEKNDIIEDWK